MLIHYSSLLSSFADKKGMANETTEMNRESVESSVNSTSNNNNNINNINAPKYGTVVPNRIFVGGISSSTTEADLAQLFSNYGHVVETKVIADRAGVSKGYGFVTFETEDEAKRLQKDSDNIVLRERRLNIAPAIKKQGFTRNTYEAVHTGTSSPVPMPTNQIVRQNGVTFTFHNGMAFFPQQAIHSQATSPVTHIQNHVESTPVYATGSPYSGVTQASTPPTFPFSYLPQGQIFYHPAHYPYHVPIESCYSIGENHNGVMIPAQASGESGGVILPGQYYITHAPPQTEMAYYNPQSPITQISIPPQETPMPPIIYATPRNFEQNSSALVYSEQNGVEKSTPVTTLTTQVEEVESSRRIPGDATPVGSVLKTSNQHRDRDNNASPRGRMRGTGHFKGRKSLPPPNDNNNNAEVHNKNSCPVTTTTTVIRGRRSPLVQSYKLSYNNNLPNSHPFRTSHFHEHTRNPPPCPVQVPQFPYYPSVPRQFFTPAYSGPPSRRPYCPRNRYGGRGRNKWYNRESIIESGIEDGNCVMPNTLTPPITPRSPQGNEATQTEDVLNSMQTLAI